MIQRQRTAATGPGECLLGGQERLTSH